MQILCLLAVPALIVWGIVFLNLYEKTQANLLPLLGLAVLLGGSVFGFEFFHVAAGPIPITLDRLLLAGLLCLCGVFYVRGSEHLRPVNGADLLILAWIGLNAISALTHDWRFLNNMPASRLLFFYFFPLALYFIMRTVRLRPSDLKWIALIMSAFGLYLAITAIAETRELSSWVFPRYIMNASEQEFLGRGRGPFLNPVANGVFMVVCSCCLWMWWPTSSPHRKALILGLSGILAAGIFCTLTRSVWIGFVASAGVFVWYPASRQSKGLMLIVATLISLAAFPVVGEKIFSFKRDKEVSQSDMEQSANLRPLFAIVAWNMFQDRPLMGCGFGQYARAKYPYLQDPYSGKSLASTKYFMQHNVFLAYLTETGLAGLFLLMAMLLVIARHSWQLWHNKQIELWPRMFGLLMIVMLLNYSINGLFHDVSIIPMQNMLLMFLFGILNNIQSQPLPFEVGCEVPTTGGLVCGPTTLGKGVQTGKRSALQTS